MSEVRLAAEQRTEFGKGAARRTRRAGRIPAVLYGHGSEPKHLSLPALEFARVVREHGNNAVLTLDLGAETELALTKTVTTHPLKNYIEHVDLLLVKRGEKVTVDVPVHVVGDAASGTLVNQELTTVQLEVEALHIPEGVEVSVQDAAVGTQIHAGDITLPRGSVLVTDAEALVVAVNAAPTAEQMEGELDTEGAGVVEEPKSDTEE
ncbi:MULTISPECIES: 50S ribosomal protein L25/general stress protein Ctc [Actinokineospora]|uniref:Large ribosomal subunit protein bL25 n=1 Tax=Actinokineospora fastidiosa TaxID=1816 RepID=A0A918G207_9PSEU|nr:MULTISPECIES: 50S ribosomal protein L25/general stress protein Ctc [Actinokineospora]UVS76947.1 General stress protein CTC [Actinokineospora sp. UTMC 2448]GGS14648.1 50S ribosomal protein L25 [Actinokineospora fastidiosa]